MPYGLLDEEEKKIVYRSPSFSGESSIFGMPDAPKPIDKNEVRLQPAEKTDKELATDYIKQKYIDDKKELEAAKDESRQRRMGVGILDSISSGIQTMTGAKAPDYRMHYAAAEMPTEDVRESQKNWKGNPNDPRNLAYKQMLINNPELASQLKSGGVDVDNFTLDAYEQFAPVSSELFKNIRSKNEFNDKLKLAGVTAQRDEIKEKRSADRKKAEELSKVQVQGYEVQPGAIPSADDSKKLKESILLKQDIDDKLNQLEGLYNKYGTELGGVAADQMQLITSSLLVNYNKLAELGALSGPDLGILEGIVPSPASVGSNLKASVGMDSTRDKIRLLRKETNDRLKARESVLGYTPVGGSSEMDGAKKARLEELRRKRDAGTLR